MAKENTRKVRLVGENEVAPKESTKKTKIKPKAGANARRRAMYLERAIPKGACDNLPAGGGESGLFTRHSRRTAHDAHQAILKQVIRIEDEMNDGDFPAEVRRQVLLRGQQLCDFLRIFAVEGKLE